MSQSKQRAKPTRPSGKDLLLPGATPTEVADLLELPGERRHPMPPGTRAELVVEAGQLCALYRELAEADERRHADLVSDLCREILSLTTAHLFVCKQHYPMPPYASELWRATNIVRELQDHVFHYRDRYSFAPHMAVRPSVFGPRLQLDAERMERIAQQWTSVQGDERLTVADDFGYVTLDGAEYAFTGQAKAIVRELFAAASKSDGGVSVADLGTKIRSNAARFRIDAAFRQNEHGFAAVIERMDGGRARIRPDVALMWRGAKVVHFWRTESPQKSQ